MGDLLDADYQVQIDDLLIGTVDTGDESWLTGPIQGLLVPAAKTADTDLGHAAGAYAGPDYTGVRTLRVPFAFNGPLLPDVLHAWRARTADTELHLRLPVWGHVWFVGRPRGLTDSLMVLSGDGTFSALGVFVANDPTMHGLGSS